MTYLKQLAYDAAVIAATVGVWTAIFMVAFLSDSTAGSYRIAWPVLPRPARKDSRNLSASGCLARFLSTAGGTVAISAPAIAACVTWRGVRIEDARKDLSLS